MRSKVPDQAKTFSRSELYLASASVCVEANYMTIENHNPSLELDQPQSFQLTHRYAERNADRFPTESWQNTSKIIEANILSIRRTVAQGDHEVLFDPAVGHDLTRLLLAYDPTRLIVTDNYLPNLAKAKNELMLLLGEEGIKTSEHQYDVHTQVISFILDAKPRQVFLVNSDSRDINTSEISIWHSYFPTGTEAETEKQRAARHQGENRWIQNDNSPEAHPGFMSLNWSIYERVKVGGFIAMNEASLIRRLQLPSELASLVGMREIAIQGRHPYTVLTSFYPEQTKEQYSGTLIQKEKKLNRESFDQAMEIIDVLRTALLMLESLEGMQLYYFKNDDGRLTRPVNVIVNLAQQLKTDFEEKLPLFEVDEQKIHHIILEALQTFQNQVEQYQQKLKIFFSLLDQSRDLTTQEKEAIFQIKKSEAGRKVSEAFPFAPDLLRATENFRDAFREVAESHFSFTYDSNT